MAGAAADRVSGCEFRVAEKTDDAEIRRLLRETPMPGAVRVGFEREPDYFAGENLAGGADETIVAFANERLVCMGRCTTRECWVNGATQRVGYLGELRLEAAARGRFRIVRDGYRFFRERQRDTPASLYFTSIASDNKRARRLLESGARGLPRYDFLGELETVLVVAAVPPPQTVPAVPRRAAGSATGASPERSAAGHRSHIVAATPERLPAMLRVLNAHGQRHQLAAVWTHERLHTLEKHGLPLDRFLLALDGDEVIACGALWDQRAFRQTVIRGYSGPLAFARPLVNFASRILRTPRLPAVGETLAHAFLSPLAFAPGAEAMLPDFIEAFFPFASQCGLEFLTIALPTMDPRLPALHRRFATRTWRSRLYRVNFPGQNSPEVSGPFLPEVALL